MLAVIFGIIVGISLGLTGGGGSILAVPMLVHGLRMDPREAAGVSLAAVGATALVGAIERISRREVDLFVGVMFALAGMLGAPLGVLVRKRMYPTVLLLLFSGLMIVVAIRMWQRATRPRAITEPAGPAHATNHALSAALGIATGILSGIFGVGGGFIIVPALVLVSGMQIHRAVATSLLVIPLVSLSGVVSQIAAREPLSWTVTLLFIAGGMLGMFAGTASSRRLSPRGLQKIFAAVIVLVALFNGLATLNWHR